MNQFFKITVFSVIAFLVIIGDSMADSINVVDKGDSAWLIVSTVLVLMMTLPGLSLFYCGLVRSVNILSVIMQCYAIACIMSVIWFFIGYSLAFGDGGSVNAWIGGLGKSFLNGVGTESLYLGVPETIFFMFQMTFAIITPALIVGAYVERIKFTHVILMSGAWLLFVYAPVTHWIWGGGFLADIGVLDFAGGLVVHATAGASAIVLVLMLGKRRHFPNDLQPPHNPSFTAIGASLLWVGWFGFNGGSALVADGSAGMVLLVTHLSAAIASLVWLALDWIRFKKPSLIGTVTGTIAGLATVTPASGFIGPIGGVACGLFGGFICYYCADVMRNKLHIDDSLDVFAVHGMGGILGIILVAIFADSAFGGSGLNRSMFQQLIVQLIGIATVVIWSAILTYLIAWTVRAMVGMRVSEKEEAEGSDLFTHGESNYHS